MAIFIGVLVGFAAGVVACLSASNGYKRAGMHEASANRILRRQNNVYYDDLLRLKKKCGEL